MVAERVLRFRYQTRPASFVFVRIIPAQERGPIDYYLHYPGFRKKPGILAFITVLGRKQPDENR